jgi:hypothetical protein
LIVVHPVRRCRFAIPRANAKVRESGRIGGREQRDVCDEMRKLHFASDAVEGGARSAVGNEDDQVVSVSLCGRRIRNPSILPTSPLQVCVFGLLYDIRLAGYMPVATYADQYQAAQQWLDAHQGDSECTVRVALTHPVGGGGRKG